MPVNLERGMRVIVKKQNTPEVGEALSHGNNLFITNQHVHIPKQDKFRDVLTQCWPQTDTVI